MKVRCATVASMIFHGIVKRGKRRGSTLGYPTANIVLPPCDADGIYAALVTVDGTAHQAAAFADQKRGVLEAHLLDFFGDLYDQEISIELVKKMRDTEVFKTDVALKTAILEDVNSVRQYFNDRA